MSISLSVLCPNARRTQIKVQPNTKVLEIIEEVTEFHFSFCLLDLFIFMLLLLLMLFVRFVKSKVSIPMSIV